MDARRAVTAGLAGTAAMTVLMLVGPMMGMPEMNIGAMLGAFTGFGTAAGWVMHFVIGSVLAVIYAMIWSRLPGGPAARGAIFGFLVFLLAQIAVMPMMGAPVFSGGDVMMIMGGLMGHLVYGVIVAVMYKGGKISSEAAA
jgi:uncharacterized membrane protein YagU involved in acid resistance